ncbi:MAG: SEC-C metal-binding domain-containing protein [archaeon]
MVKELMDSIKELKQYDNEKGYKLDYKTVKKKLELAIKEIIGGGEKTLEHLHKHLENEKTWSSLFALEALKEIKSEKSIHHLIDYIVKTEKGDFGDSGEEAMFALTNIGESAIEPLLQEIKIQFEKKKFYFYLTGALTEIKNEKVYEFMRKITEDYIRDEEKYDEWFHIDAFVHDFDKQGKKEIILLLKELLKLDRTSKHERIEIKDTIEKIGNPEEYRQKLEKEIEKTKPLIEEYMKEEPEGKPKIDQKEFEERMWTPEEDLEIQFKCQECDKKQNINPGLIKILGDKGSEFVFENEILCKFCFSDDIKLTEQGGRDVMFQSIGTFMGSRKGVVSASDETYVENKSMPFKTTYDYILKRIEQDPNKGELYLRAGNVARNFNKYSEAIRHYEKAIEINAKLIATYLNLVEIYEFRYKYYKIKDAKSSAIFYLNGMMDLFRTQDFNSSTLQNKNMVVQFMGEKSESLGVHIPELVKAPLSKKRKIGRNESCPCGSGKKYKKCCLGKTG